MSRKIVALCPAYNEEDSIGATIEALIAQTRPLDRIVIIPNGCKDRTAEIARSYMSPGNNIVVLELPRLKHKKSEALNLAWMLYGRYADIVISLDADTIFPPNTVENWELDFVHAEMMQETARAGSLGSMTLGGSSSKATMPKPDFWGRLQKAEFAKWCDTSLIRGYTTVLAGTGCAISGDSLRRVAARDDREGPWSYMSEVEDFELTIRIRELGYRCIVSPWVRVQTDSMSSLKTLWPQRMKWAAGTVEELLNFGITKLTLVDWGQQLLGLTMLLVRLMFIAMLVAQFALGVLHFDWFWWVAYPASFAVTELWLSKRIPDYDWKDRTLAATFFPNELFGTIRMAWFAASWASVLKTKLTGKRKDRWEAQYAAEGIGS